jgi:hypothetical protein
LIANQIQINLIEKNLKIRFAELPENPNIEIYHSKGKRILQQSVNQLITNIKLPKLKSGDYFLKILSNQELYYFSKIKI